MGILARASLLPSLLGRSEEGAESRPMAAGPGAQQQAMGGEWSERIDGMPSSSFWQTSYVNLG